jgi:hypothetical protein
MPSDFDHTLAVTVHAIYTLRGFREHEFVDPVLAVLALEAMGVIIVITGHDRLVQYRLLADITAIGAVGTNRGTI